MKVANSVHSATVISVERLKETRRSVSPAWWRFRSATSAGSTTSPADRGADVGPALDDTGDGTGDEAGTETDGAADAEAAVEAAPAPVPPPTAWLTTCAMRSSVGAPESASSRSYRARCAGSVNMRL